ncbi:3-oxoacyl-ACP reductase FabG [Streptomyces sp. ME19-01-6]|uniref:3-oxoacyl-ACP reductase FabG n=1 Tax=Streptomyces sp. ME19-01-6 TaxID=3028686 RepID=UPI0029BF1683|nr:3-oxoacyl-ACP reductase FabG [Streptomyces sp. ME19-01-6]MDX3225000.1 3-oxoacyl-ACP reductase FabG [Streptomyces sp. ME19-01-6]
MSRVAVVTGASRGIGQAIAVALAEAGHRVAVGYRSGGPAARETLDLISQVGGEGLLVRGDVGVRADVDEMFTAVEDAFGPVELLVNNAGIVRDGLAVTLSDADWEQVLRTNLHGPFYCARRALRGMLRRRWGRIVNVGSIVGLLGSTGQVNYASAKAGLIGMTRSLAREVAGRNITVNTVVPGPIGTEILSELSPERLAELSRMAPMNRMGTPTEVAAAVTFLASEAAAFITGTTLPVDGGISMGG